MQKLSVCAVKKNRKAVLELLQSMGCMDIETSDLEDPDLQKMDTTRQRQIFLRNAEMFDEAVRLFDIYAHEKKSGGGLFAEPEQVERSRLDSVMNRRRELVAAAQKVQQAEKTIGESKGAILKDQSRIDSLKSWIKLPIPMDSKGTKKTAILIGTIPGTVSDEVIYAAATAQLTDPAPVSAEVLTRENDETNLVVVCMKKDLSKVETSLREIGFANPSVKVSGIPADREKELEQDIERLRGEIAQQEELIRSEAAAREDFLIAADYFRTRAAKYELLGTIPQSENVFFLEGWVRADQAKAISKMLEEKFGAFVEEEEKREDETEPTLLHNNKFSESVEGVLESYGLPQHGKIDPTFIMSFFYVIFFGMMFSDGGYGILMAVACFIILKKHKRMAQGTRKTMKMFFWCGISTAFWGFMYGGFFGDAIDTVAQTFFGYPSDQTILKPLWFEPMGQPMRLLVWCMFFGLIHLFFGLGIAGAQYIKDHDFIGFFSDVFSWYLFLIGLVLLLLPSELFSSIAGDSFDFSWAAGLGTAAKWMAIIGCVIIVLMQERSAKNPILRILLGAYDVYGITSWLSDVLSYSRLLALGLATGVIANVVNMMASMGGKSVVGVIMFIVIFLLGHTLNFGINALGAYVHTNRLQYVEFFGKFYEGGGKPFRPFKTANKYIQIKGDNSL